MTNAAETKTLELYKCMNYMVTTVDGILAANNPNVWNVFGGLSRAKKAIFDIFTNGLRLYDEKSTQDMIMMLAADLLKQFPCSDGTNELELSTDVFLSWIEHHLLAHSLLDCITCAFLHKTEENSLRRWYKEYAFLKNDILLKELLSCLEALQQSSLHLLSCITSILTNKESFMNEFTPWVSKKMLEEYKIDHQPPDILGKNTFFLQNNFNKSDNLCSCSNIPSQIHPNNNLNNCKCSEKWKCKSVSLQPFSREVLMKSALSAAVSQDGYNPASGWYEDDITMESDFDDTWSKLALMKEISRSESSLIPGTGYLTNEIKENKSENDELDCNIDEKSTNLSDDDEFSLHNLHLPRSSSTVQRRKGHQRSKSDHTGVSQIDYIDIDCEKIVSEVTSSSLPKELSRQGSEESQTYYYQNEDGKLFPKPYKGQSLISYLDSRSYDTGAQLDKENAHFSICEALITAIEQMRCQKMDSGNDTDDSSDEEIKSLKEKLRDRRWVRRMEKQKKDALAFSDISDTGKSSSFKTSSTLSSSVGSSNADEMVDPGDDLGTITDSWENLSLASKIKSPQSTRKEESERDEQKFDEVPDDYSAEAVAKCLLKKFDGHSIPAASELKWIVTEEDVPQELLPLPTAFPVNPDTHLQNDPKLVEGFQKMSLPFQSLLRGNLEWAPPRPQIIFSTHPFVKRKVMLQRQHFRCAGCGLKVSPSLSKRFRFCEYLGKYFCTSCHQNKLTYIPSKIMSKWDFKKYPVSDFAKELLKKIYRDPLFNVQDISPSLYKNVRVLAMVKKLRIQLHHMKNFINTCRHAIVCRKEIEKLAMHLIEDPHSYSVDDLLQVKTGEMHTHLKSIVATGVKHITEDCPLCSAKGFFCEFCRDMDDILYPFDLQKVYICEDCKTCYHRTCFVQGKCAKCERIRVRKTMIQEPLPDLDSPTGRDS